MEDIMKLLKIDDNLHKELKTLAAKEGKQIQDVANEAVQLYIHK